MSKDLFGNQHFEGWTWKNPNPHSRLRHLVRFIPRSPMETGREPELRMKTACGMSIAVAIVEHRVTRQVLTEVDCSLCRRTVQKTISVGRKSVAEVPLYFYDDLTDCELMVGRDNAHGFSQFAPLAVNQDGEYDPMQAVVAADWLEEQGDPAANLLRVVIGRVAVTSLPAILGIPRNRL